MKIIKQIGHLIVYPADQFEEMKYEKQWNVGFSFIILLFWFFSMIAQKQESGFIFNMNNLNDLNILYIFFSTFMLFIFGVICNWSVTTLLDGKGNFKEIWASCSYALIPYIVSIYLNVILSRFFIMEEGSFLVVIECIGIIWSGYLIITALRVVHSYSFSKTVLSIIFTVIGILFVLFLIVLMFGLIQQVISFFQTIYFELMYRR